MLLTVTLYFTITKTPKTEPVPLHTLYSLTHIYFHIYDFIMEVKGGLEHQCQLFYGTFRVLNWILPSL